MKRNVITTIAVAAGLAWFPAAIVAQDSHPVHLHVNSRWKECSFQLDASLTQKAWRQFSEEAGLVTYFRPLADARPMGAGKWEVSAMQWQTGIDDTDAAWNDTFVHPDSAHWLFEGSGLAFPGLMIRGGINTKLDAGAYFTKNPNANYGFYGGQLQYNVAGDTKRDWAASARMSFVSLFGPSDLDFTVLGMDLVASKTYRGRWASVSPYAGVSSYFSMAHEKSAVVDLADERVGGSLAMVGAVAKVSVLTVGMEYSSAKVRSRSLKIGVSF